MSDAQFQRQNCHILLTLDNFAAHEKLSYQLTNIQLEYFEPNMTLFVQPLDQSIIWCFKAHYHKAFCLWAIELDDAGVDDIYEINLLEAMLMAQEAWDAVSPEMIQNCWKHADIQWLAIWLPSQISGADIFLDLAIVLPLLSSSLNRLGPAQMYHSVMQAHGQ